MKNPLKLTTRALVMGTVLAGGITLAQSFYSETQASAPIICTKLATLSGNWQCPAMSASTSCVCGSTGYGF